MLTIAVETSLETHESESERRPPTGGQSPKENAIDGCMASFESQVSLTTLEFPVEVVVVVVEV